MYLSSNRQNFKKIWKERFKFYKTNGMYKLATKVMTLLQYMYSFSLLKDPSLLCRPCLKKTPKQNFL